MFHKDWISPVEMAFTSLAFDLVDTSGRTFPLLLHFRPADAFGDLCNAAGALVSRDSAHTVLATIRCPKQWSAALDMTDESASFFATYAPHRDVEAQDIQFSQLSPFDNAETVVEGPLKGMEGLFRLAMVTYRKDKWVSLWAAANQPGACGHASSSDSEMLVTQTSTAAIASTRERGHVVLEELRTLCCAAARLSCLRPKEYSMFSAYHPPAVVRSFTVAALSPVLLSVPSDVLGLIADYAWLELPYLPMSLPVEDRGVFSEWSASTFYDLVEDEKDMDPDHDD